MCISVNEAEYFTFLLSRDNVNGVLRRYCNSLNQIALTMFKKAIPRGYRFDKIV